MKTDMKDIQITGEMICNFVDGRTSAAEDRIIFAKMQTDKVLAQEIKELMMAVNAVVETDAAVEEPFAAAAFSDNSGKKQVENNSIFSSPFKSTDNMADNFLAGYEDE